MDQAIAGEISETTARTRVNYAKWIWRVVTWDGVVPLVMFGLPHVMRAALPNLDHARATEFFILPPSIALLVRLVVGYFYTTTNNCPTWLKSAQQLSLVVGIVMLALSDFFMAASVVNVGNPDENSGHLFWMSLFVLAMAFPLMIFVLYPGREPIPSTQLGNWEIEC